MKRYRTIVADPPWPYPEGFVSYPGARKARNAEGKQGGQRRVARPLPYQAMTLDEIMWLPVGDMADGDCRLFLWTTNRYLPEAFRVLAAWGFEYKQTLVWHKHTCASPFGGSVAPNRAEYLLVGTRGAPPVLDRWPTSVIDAPGMSGNRVGTHSRKPDIFNDVVERVSPGPYLEMFARRARLGDWDYWGNESLGTAEVAV